MTAVALAGPRETQTGLHRTDPRRDLEGIARLVQMAFAGQLDSVGQRLLRDMRWLGRAGWFGWLLGRFVLPSGSMPDGFVWLKSGKVVGNLSLLSIEGDPLRWVIANVAVAPEERRRGIGRALVQAAIDLARQQGLRRLVLQVDRSNQVAGNLYRSLGFVVTSTRTTWIRPRGLPRPPQVDLEGLRPRRFPEWREQWELGGKVLPDGFWWPFPPDERVFRGSGVQAAIGMDWTHHWVWKPEALLLASLSAHARLTGGFRFLLLVDALHRGHVEKALLARALADLPEGSGGTLEYPADVAEPDLWELGFRPDRSLTWMALDLPTPRSGAAGPEVGMLR